MPKYLTERDGVWHFARRVPEEFVALDPRGVIKQSTKIRVVDDKNGVRASVVATQMNEVLDAYWRGLVEGKGAEAQRRYDEARARARAMGLTYLPAADLVSARLVHEVMERVEKLEKLGALTPSRRHAAVRTAVLGGEEPPQILLSDLFEKFEAQSQAEITDLSPDQKRKWKNPKVRAITNLISVIGDMAITEITAIHALDFSEWWQARITDEQLNPGTANKDMGHLSRMLFKVNQRYRLGLTKVFDGMKLEGATENTRPPFDTDYIQKRLLAPGALGGLNEEARRLVFLIMDAGLRPTEAVNLNGNTIMLGGKIPHVRVIPDGRRLKTPQSERDVPLVGVALAAARLHPEGFPRYHDSGAELSATVNKFLDEHNLRQDGRRTLYSLRHSFKDRLTEAKAEDSMIDALMGHKETGSKYGRGPSLELKREVLHRIAFTPPAIL
jgi:integrase